jgi:hypothetical protein
VKETAWRGTPPSVVDEKSDTWIIIAAESQSEIAIDIVADCPRKVGEHPA